MKQNKQKQYKLVCFDLDGTIVDETVSIWQTIHDHLKTDAEKRREFQEKFKRKEITYEEWARMDVKLWEASGATREEIMKALEPLRLMKGARETLETLKNNGIKMVIISGSLNIVLEKVLPDYYKYFDHVFINYLYFDENGKIKQLTSTMYDSGNKGDALKIVSETEKIPLKKTVFVGDNKNDVDVAKVAGLSIAFNPQCEEIKQSSDIVIEKKDLREILKHIT